MRRGAKLVHHPRTRYRMSGLTLDQFQTLTNRLTPLWEQAERTRLSQRVRQHALGQGRQDQLTTLADTRLGGLVCSRCYLTDERLGWLVGLDASAVCRLQQKLEPLLERAVTPALQRSLRWQLPPGVKKVGTWEERRERCPDFAEVLTDATEQVRPRPPRRTQRRWDTGSRQRHMLKTQLTVSRHGRSLHVSQTVPGRVPGYALFKRMRLAERLPSAARLALDRGYDEASTDDPTLAISLPVKRHRNHRGLPRAERAFNRHQARQRIIVEHVLSRVKKYQRLAQGSRHRIADSHRRFRHVAALGNVRLATALASGLGVA